MHKRRIGRKRMSKTAGQTLRESRKKVGLSQEQLGELVGCGRANIAKFEGDKKIMSVDWARRFAPHLGVKPFQLLPDLGIEEKSPLEAEGLTEESFKALDDFYKYLLQKQGGKT